MIKFFFINIYFQDDDDYNDRSIDRWIDDYNLGYYENDWSLLINRE